MNAKTNTNTNHNTLTAMSAEPKTLPEFLATIPDPRRGQGKMHPMTLILLIILMATMSGCFGQRPAADFIKRHRVELLKALKPTKDRLPSRQTIARVLQDLDFDQFSAAFFAWAKTVVPIGDKEWVDLDGKGIGGTVTQSGTAQQRYTNLVSVFVQKSKQVLLQGKVEDKTNEIPLVVQLVKQLHITGLVFTADALHAQKQTTEAIITSGNDYVLQVKGNQKKLHTALKKTLPSAKLSVAM